MSALPRAYVHRSESVAFTAAVPMPLIRQLISSARLKIPRPLGAVRRRGSCVPERAIIWAQIHPPTVFCSPNRLIERVKTELRSDSTYRVARNYRLGTSQTRL
jgi:hypothetical protein